LKVDKTNPTVLANNASTVWKGNNISINLTATDS
jgi:hypothetical protein